MGTISRDAVYDVLKTVTHLELHKDLVSLGMIKDVAVDGSTIRIGIELTTSARPLREQIGRDVETAVKKLAGVTSVEVDWSPNAGSSRPGAEVLPGVKNVVAVGAGKGGVGKSTAAVLLAYGLHRKGASVGLLDADVYGPNIPTMTGIEGSTPAVRDNRLIPVEAGGVKIMSVGFMVARDKPLIWRGPMVHGVIKQFLEQVDWGELDYLIVDLPPGTGDVPLTLAQSIPMTGAVVICTPQDIALLDARRAVRMYEELKVPCLGIIENMSYYLCPKCGHRDEIFDHGGAAEAAEALGAPFLGEIPLNVQLRVFADRGTPEKAFTDAPDYVRQAIDRVVANTAEQVDIKSKEGAQAPTLSIE